MNTENKSFFKVHKKLTICISTVLLLVIAIFICSAIYLGSYCHADDYAAAAMAGGDGYTVRTVDGNVVFYPDYTHAGLIFYPGGKVEHTAYAPLMAEFAKNGILCILVKMPLRLAIFDMDAADGIQEAYSEITKWYIGGHSLGGVIAADYAVKNHDSFDGLLLLASYSTKDLKNSGLDVISVYGSNDRVLNMDKYKENIVNLPSEYDELIIPGGCHSYFGSYGLQKGDGEPSVTKQEQISDTVDFFLNAIGPTPQ